MISLSKASEKEMPVIEYLAKKFDLDCDALSYEQFITAKNYKTVIGIGRLRQYSGCAEVATVGVIAEERNRGVGSIIVNELIRSAGTPDVFVTCVIPYFFHKLGFHTVKQYPPVLQKKVDFCKSYDFSDEQIFVMRFTKV